MEQITNDNGNINKFVLKYVASFVASKTIHLLILRRRIWTGKWLNQLVDNSIRLSIYPLLALTNIVHNLFWKLFKKKRQTEFMYE